MASVPAHTLALVEVIPVAAADLHDETAGPPDGDGGGYLPPISAPSAKMQLLNMSRQGMFSKGWLDGEVMADHGRGQSQSRGMWLAPNLERGRRCKICGGLPKSQEVMIISGDIIFHGKDAGTNADQSTSTLPITYLRSDDPLDEDGVPCQLRGYIIKCSGGLSSVKSCYCDEAYIRCEMTSGTAVQVCHRSHHSTEIHPNSDILHILSGRSNDVSQDASDKENEPGEESPPLYSKLSCYNEETVKSLSLRMSTMLENTAWIGTTTNAFHARKARLLELEAMEHEMDAFWGASESDGTDDVTKPDERKIHTVPILLREGALLVHNSHSNSGKTALVATIAKDTLKCDAVHVISASALFAKFGTSADAALESTLHELALRCAVRGGSNAGVPSICIILDHLETFLPLSGQPGADPYLPVLNAIASYLNRLSHSLKTKNEFPFPSNNPLYNVCYSSGPSSGFTVPIGICLVGVITCSDSNKGGSTFQRALDALGGGRFRVPLPSATTRLSALEHAFASCGVRMTEDAKKALPEIIASVTWASGSAFLDIARTMRSHMIRSGASAASEHDLRRAISIGRGPSTAEPYSADFPSLSASHKSKKAPAFSTVGGNSEAKLALEDALALDPTKRQLLAKFGVQTPTGVLLYGPPGTGKTLLARAVAQTLYSENDSGVGGAGGAFVALKASDIVRPEVGNSEKLIVSAFETARLNAPSVVFIDEFQALFGDREGGSFILGQLASTLLQCMDDVTRWSGDEPSVGVNSNATKKNGRIVVLGATNIPWMIDRAFLRPGRFDRAVHVGLPSVEEAEQILRVHVSRMKLAPVAVDASPVHQICKDMSTLCLGFSGADLAALCRAAAVRCLSAGNGTSGVTQKHLQDAYMHDVMRSSNDKLVRRIAAWQP